MQKHFAGAKSKKAKTEALVRRYGFGVPSLERALRSANNALTLVVQDTIAPFSDGKMNEMHLHPLPWPKDVLEELFDAPVRLRVTLSYFVEPNPAQKKRDRSQFGARYALIVSIETDRNDIDIWTPVANEVGIPVETPPG